MVCKNCGAELRAEAKFCDECGTVVEKIKPAENEEVVAAETTVADVVEEKTSVVNTEETKPAVTEENKPSVPPVAPVTQPEKKEKSKPSAKRIGILLIIIIATLAVIFGVYAFISSLLGSSPSGYSDSGTPPANQQNYSDDSYNASSTGDVQYIGNRRVQYNDADEQYVVFFSLADSADNYISASGEAVIVIKDTTGNELLNRTYQFTENDFTNWTNSSRDGERYMCGLYINKSDIAGSASSQGILTLTVYGETFSFDSYNMDIYDLPEKALSISFPSTPYTVYEYDYDGSVEFVLEVQQIYFETTSNYDGEISGKLCAKVKMLTNNSGTTSSYSHVGFKLKNSESIFLFRSSHYD